MNDYFRDVCKRGFLLFFVFRVCCVVLLFKLKCFTLHVCVCVIECQVIYYTFFRIVLKKRAECVACPVSRLEEKNNASIVVFCFGFGLVRISILMSFYLTAGKLNNDRWICKCEDNESGRQGVSE